MIRLLSLLVLLPAAVAAQDLTTDAFGIVPTAAMGGRANWAGLRETTDGQSMVQPAGPSDAAVLFVGPKSIVAGLEPGHAVALGLDVYGNMIDGAATDFVLGFGESRRVVSRDGIADVLFTPPTNADNYLAGADFAGVLSARADYRVTAHLATVEPDFATAPEGMLPETFDVIATNPLVDAYGNLVDDGVGLGIVLTDAAGQFTYLPSVVRDGTGQSVLLSRDLAGPVSGELALAGQAATGASFTISQMVLSDAGAFLVWPEPSIDAVHLRVGPLSTARGFLVPDGTAGAVAVSTGDGAGLRAAAWVLDGYLSFVLPLDPANASFDITLTVGSNTVNRTVPLTTAPANTVIRGTE